VSKLQRIAEQFAGRQAIIELSPLGNGLINDTYLGSSRNTQFVLQRLNSRVFPHPEQVIANLSQLNRHISRQLPDSLHLRIPAMLPATDGQLYFQDDEGQTWRALELISPAESRERLANTEEAEQVGFALAHFHRLCSTLPTDSLYDTLPGFHIAPDYFQNYLSTLNQPLQVPADDDFRQCRSFIDQCRERIDVLEQAKQRGELQLRVIHGDPKLNNFLFEPGGNLIVSLIDLDTVKPGLVHYDIGDCLRSCCHIEGNNRFDLNLCRQILRRYLREAGSFFTEADYRYLYSAIWLIPFELGLRFFSDYLAGDRYFKIDRPRHNLQRAQAQFALSESIAAQRLEIERMIAELSEQAKD
jgi:Ser/Thr protein kinase RdoA (MazF antagonist)